MAAPLALLVLGLAGLAWGTWSYDHDGGWAVALLLLSTALVIGVALQYPEVLR